MLDFIMTETQEGRRKGSREVGVGDFCNVVVLGTESVRWGFQARSHLPSLLPH